MSATHLSFYFCFQSLFFPAGILKLNMIASDFLSCNWEKLFLCGGARMCGQAASHFSGKGWGLDPLLWVSQLVAHSVVYLHPASASSSPAGWAALCRVEGPGWVPELLSVVPCSMQLGIRMGRVSVGQEWSRTGLGRIVALASDCGALCESLLQTWRKCLWRSVTAKLTEVAHTVYSTPRQTPCVSSANIIDVFIKHLRKMLCKFKYYSLCFLLPIQACL